MVNNIDLTMTFLDDILNNFIEFCFLIFKSREFRIVIGP